MSHNDSETPGEIKRRQVNLGDDVRSFLLERLFWKRLTKDEREEMRRRGLDKRLRRPSYMQINPVCDKSDAEDGINRCELGAEGVMTHVNDRCVHLAFKCGHPKHSYHYTAFDVETVAAMARACEATWPGSMTRVIDSLRVEKEAADDEGPLILDPGDDDDDGFLDVDIDEDLDDEAEEFDDYEDEPECLTEDDEPMPW